MNVKTNQCACVMFRRTDTLTLLVIMNVIHKERMKSDLGITTRLVR